MIDERWKECCHHHHGCSCREHMWEEKVSKLEAEIEVLKNLHSQWEVIITEQFMKMGKALEGVRERLPSGEPSRDDATEVEALVSKVATLEVERDSLQQQVNEMAKVIAADTRRMLGLEGYRHE